MSKDKKPSRQCLRVALGVGSQLYTREVVGAGDRAIDKFSDRCPIPFCLFEGNGAYLQRHLGYHSVGRECELQGNVGWAIYEVCKELLYR